MAQGAPHPLLTAAGATHSDGVWRVTAASLAAATAAQPALGQRRCYVGDYDAQQKRVSVVWASAAALAAWETEHVAVMSDKLSRIAHENSALASIFGGAMQAALRGDSFVHHVATGAGSALQRIRFVPVDLVESDPDALEQAPAAAEDGAGPRGESAGARALQQPAARGGGRVRRCMLDELLLPDEPSPQHEQLLLRARALLRHALRRAAFPPALTRADTTAPLRAEFADRYSSSLLTVVSLTTHEVLYQNPASLTFHGFLPRTGAGVRTWITATLLGGDEAALNVELDDVSAKRTVRLRARVAAHQAAASTDTKAPPLAEGQLLRWHEVVMTPGVDPVTLKPVVVVTESDISSLKAAEAELSRLHAEQLDDYARSEAALEALVCSCFPEHVASELLENLIAARDATESDVRRTSTVSPLPVTPASSVSPRSQLSQTPPEGAATVGSPPRLGVMARRRSGGKLALANDAAAGAAAAAFERASTAPASLYGAGRDRAAISPRPSMPVVVHGFMEPGVDTLSPLPSSPLAPPPSLPHLHPSEPLVLPGETRRNSLTSETPHRSAAADGAAALLARVRAAGAQGRVAARRHPCISVVFTDIEGFTAVSSEADPSDVMSMLHELFAVFDALADRYGSYKVETIGDAYVAAVGDGIGTAGNGSAAACAAVAVQFGAACAAAAGSVLTPGPPGTPRTGEPVSIRVGIHSGAAMSGVVGAKMPRYAFFGDTMNTASRMESTGLPGRVQVSVATRELADAAGTKTPFTWRRRGEVDIKGKGRMATYLLRSGPGGVCAGAEGEGEGDGGDVVRTDSVASNLGAAI